MVAHYIEPEPHVAHHSHKGLLGLTEPELILHIRANRTEREYGACGGGSGGGGGGGGGGGEGGGDGGGDGVNVSVVTYPQYYDCADGGGDDSGARHQ